MVEKQRETLEIRHGGRFREALNEAMAHLESGSKPDSANMAHTHEIDGSRAVKLTQVAEAVYRSGNQDEDSPPIDGESLSLALVGIDPFDLCPEILQIIGPEKFLRIIEIFGGLTVKFPTLGAVKAAIRNVEILKEYHKGVPVGVLAERSGVDDREIRRRMAHLEKSMNFGWKHAWQK